MQKYDYYIIINNVKINVGIKRFERSKSVRLIVNNNGCTVTAPKRYSQSLIYKYVNENTKFIYEAYIKSQELLNSKDKRRWVTGEYILYKGTYLKTIVNLIDEDKIYIKLLEDSLKIEIKKDLKETQKDKIIRSAVIKLFKDNCKLYLNDRLRYWSDITKIKYNSFKVKDVKSKWGSCSANGNLNFSYKIIMMSPYISDHIIVHELCHIKYMNHSKEFWDLVYSYLPNYKQQEKWLRDNVNMLEI